MILEDSLGFSRDFYRIFRDFNGFLVILKIFSEFFSDS